MKEKTNKKQINKGVWNSRASPIKPKPMQEYLRIYKQMQRRRNAFGFNIDKYQKNLSLFLLEKAHYLMRLEL